MRSLYSLSSGSAFFQVLLCVGTVIRCLLASAAPLRGPKCGSLGCLSLASPLCGYSS